MFTKEFFSIFRCRIACIWLLTYKFLNDYDQVIFFKSFQMTGQITIGYSQSGFQTVEIIRIIYDKD